MALLPWTEEQVDAFLEMQFRAQHTDYSNRFPDAVHSIVVADGVDVGRIWVDGRPEEIRLLDIALLPEHRGRGIGSTLLGRLQEEASRAGVALRHSVDKGNDGAKRLYERHGFAVIEDWELHELMEWRQKPAG